MGILNGKTYDIQLIVSKEEHVLEVAEFIGSFVKEKRGNISIHIHVTLGRDHGEVYAGYLSKAEVDPFLEVFILEGHKI